MRLPSGASHLHWCWAHNRLCKDGAAQVLGCLTDGRGSSLLLLCLAIREMFSSLRCRCPPYNAECLDLPCDCASIKGIKCTNIPCRELATATEPVGTFSMEAAVTSVIRMRMQRKRASSIPTPWILAMHSKPAPSKSLTSDFTMVIHCISHGKAWSHVFAKCRSGPAVDVIPTMKTQNERICLFLNDGRAGYLRIEDAERLQVRSSFCYA